MPRLLATLLAGTALAAPALAQDTVPGSPAPAPVSESATEPVVTAGDGSPDRDQPDALSTRTATGDDADALLQTYPPPYFNQFQPVTALDMVRQVPGFSLRGGSGGARGFGEANTNFLINGRRPSTKGQDAGDLLSRITADSVVRIEVLDGASLDIPGLSGQVVNVVARAVNLSGSYEYSARLEDGTKPQVLEGEVNLTGETGNLAFAVTLDAGQFTRTENGVEIFATDALARGGTVFEDRTEDVFIENTRPSISANMSWTPPSGHLANINARVQRPNNIGGIRETFTAVGPGGETGVSEGVNGEDEWEVELSGDYALPLGSGTLKLIGLYRFEDSDFSTRFVEAVDGRDPVLSVFLRDEEENERIARAEYAFGIGGSHDIQASVEYAFNSLDSVTVFENNFVSPITDSVVVEEDRFEARVSDSWTVSDAVTVQGSIGAEYSELGVVAPGEEPRSFFRPKGFIASSYQQSDLYTWRARVERGVGQLNFGTFVTTRSLAENVVTSGNEEIVPDQFWNLSFELERTDPTLFSGRIEPFYRRIEDPIDQVLFADGTEGPGNLDSAEFFGVEAEGTLLMDTLGVPGLRLEAEVELRDSGIDDPLTGVRRRLNGDTRWEYELEARYDIPGTAVALTTELYDESFAPSFRFDDRSQVFIGKPEWTAGIIFKDIAGLQLSARVQNLLKSDIIRERERFFGPDRRLGAITRFERFSRDRGRRLNLTLSGTF